MNTYLVKTAAPRGPRSITTETWIVNAVDETDAKCKAEAASLHPGAKVKSIKHVPLIERVHVG